MLVAVERNIYLRISKCKHKKFVNNIIKNVFIYNFK